MLEISRKITRRDAAKRLGAGVLFTFTFESTKAGDAGSELLSSRIHVGDDGAITVLTGKVEIGQGIRTTLAQAAAEELRVPFSQVRLIMGDTALVPDDGGTWGSLTTPQTMPVIRQACASLRELRVRCQAKTYAELAGMPQFSQARAQDSPLTDPKQWKVLGTPVPNVNGPHIVSGKLTYSSDRFPENVLHGKIIRGPNYRSKLLAFDDSKARSLEGVRIVHEENFLGVTAPTRELAEKAAQLIESRWSSGELGDPNLLFDRLRRNAKPVEGGGGRYPSLIQSGSVEQGLASAHRKLNATYQLAYIAHIPLECRTAVAQWTGNRLTVHCGTQAPFLVRSEIAEFFKIPEENVRVIVSDTGSGYGGKHASECELEAARLARGINQPVRLAWTRNEESTCAHCRPAALIDVRSGIDQHGKVIAWDFHNINGGPAGLTPPYEIPNRFAGFHESDSPLRQGSYRSLAAAGNAFARESQIDEMAHLAGLDPLEFRLRNISNERLKTVLLRAADRFGWSGRKAADGTGYGLACNIEKGGHIALCAELEVRASDVHLRRFVAAFDAGAVANPDMLSNQVEGALVQGIGGALFEELRFDRDRITNGVLSRYRVPRFSDVPEIEVILVDRRDQPSAGAGECPITAVAPAIANAIFSATGKRIREMPMLPALRRA
ncbi:MAG TPA: molybdopterin cofactor-binding domain-containing protein [Bryobacteraceae bacterium]|jgi:isoquinoline 1-oxidoreductase|nr:molybdopterin cofactor-binding domain-containing protein [Bryobacteraceae bacterium]